MKKTSKIGARIFFLRSTKVGICVVSNSFLYCIDMFPDSIDLKKRSTGKILNFQEQNLGGLGCPTGPAKGLIGP